MSEFLEEAGGQALIDWFRLRRISAFCAHHPKYRFEQF